MGVDALGGGIIFAIAAALWMVYLIPTWMRSRQYFATERNAVRLQQTLRILAETAEVPQQVHMESAARVVFEQKRALRLAEAAAESESRTAADVVAKLRRIEAASRIEELERQATAAEAARVSAAAAAEVAKAARAQAATVPGGGRRRIFLESAGPAGSAVAPRVPPAMSSRVLRRLRQVSASILLAGMIGLPIGITLLVTEGAGVVLAAAVVTVGMAFASIIRLAKLSSARPIVAVPETSATSAIFDVDEFASPVQARVATWTPTPLPKPLYLSRGTVASAAMASIDAAADLRRAEEKRELERRAAELERIAARERRVAAVAAITPIRTPAAGTTARPQNRFARMGVVDETLSANIDLDAVLSRRRAG